MGYSIHFKPANLKQIFTLAAGEYVRDCTRDVTEVINAEAAKRELVAQIHNRPMAWNVTGELTESVEKKLKALPFVDRLETDDETRSNGKRHENIVKKKLRGWILDIVYR